MVQFWKNWHCVILMLPYTRNDLVFGFFSLKIEVHEKIGHFLVKYTSVSPISSIFLWFPLEKNWHTCSSNASLWSWWLYYGSFPFKTHPLKTCNFFSRFYFWTWDFYMSANRYQRSGAYYIKVCSLCHSLIILVSVFKEIIDKF